METGSLQSPLRGGVLVLGLISICAAGCWQEVHYTGPDPSTIARREKQQNAEPPVATVEPEEPRTPRDESPESSPPSIDEETPTSESAREMRDEPAGKADIMEADMPGEAAVTHDPLFDDAEPEPPSVPSQTRAEPVATAEAVETAAPELAESVREVATRQAAWQLGSKLTLAALAHDRGLAPTDVATWFDEARAAAEALGTSIAELPAPAETTKGGGSSQRVHEYLLEQGRKIHGDLTARHGAEHAALFEMAVKSGVLLVLYEPGSTVVEPLSNSIRQAAEQNELPTELWQPLLDAMGRQSPAAEVRMDVRRMHADVDTYLMNAAERE